MNGIVTVKKIKTKYDFFIGIDSDGTVFDTMVIKHNKVFIPMAIKIWHLEKIEKEIRI